MENSVARSVALGVLTATFAFLLVMAAATNFTAFRIALELVAAGVALVLIVRIAGAFEQRFDGPKAVAGMLAIALLAGLAAWATSPWWYRQGPQTARGATVPSWGKVESTVRLARRGDRSAFAVQGISSTKEVEAQRDGFALGRVEISLRNCRNLPSTMTVIVDGLRRDSFVEAQFANDRPRAVPFDRNERVMYPSSAFDGIGFNFIRDEYVAYAPVLKPFVGAGSALELVVKALALLFSLVIIPIALDVLKDRAKGWFARKRETAVTAPPSTETPQA